MKRAVALLFALLVSASSAASADAAVVEAIWLDDDGDRLILFYDDEIAIPGQAVTGIEFRLAGAINRTTLSTFGSGGEIINQLASAPTRLEVLAGTPSPLSFSYTNLDNPDILSVTNDGITGVLGEFSFLNGTLTLERIPEPSTASLLLLGLVGVVRHRRRKAA